MWRAVLRALTSDFEVEVEDEKLAAAVEPLLRTLGPARFSPRLSYRLEAGARFRLWRDGELVNEFEVDLDLPPAFELDLYRRVIARCRDELVLHAAALAVGGEALVLFGPSGAGKSTLATALLERGASYLTDECAAVGWDDRVTGLARPINLADGADGRAPRSFSRGTVLLRTRDLEIKQHRLLYPPRASVRYEPAPLGSVAFIEHAPGEPTHVRTLSPREALQSLWPCVLHQTPAALRLAVDMARRHPIRRVRSSRIDEACAALLAPGAPARRPGS